MKEKKYSDLYFIHANGFLPDAYSTLFKNIKEGINTHNYLLLDILKNKKSKLKNWIIFHDSFIETIKHNKIIGMGHSIGGNIILRSAITKPSAFKGIVLLDPTLFTPKIIFFWQLSYYLGNNIQHKFHPWLKSTLNRKMKYDNIDVMFKAYRKKEVFNKIDNENLKIYIKSLIDNEENCNLIYPKEYEYMIYKTGLLADNYIWKNIHKIKIPTLIIRADNSNAFLKESAQKVCKLNNNIKMITLKDSTHLFPLEQPVETASLINQFIKDFL